MAPRGRCDEPGTDGLREAGAAVPSLPSRNGTVYDTQVSLFEGVDEGRPFP